MSFSVLFFNCDECWWCIYEVHHCSRKGITPCALTCSGNFLSYTQSWRDRKAKCEKQYVRETFLTIRPPHNFVMRVVKIYCINKCWTKWNWTKWSFWDTHRLKNLPEVQHGFLFLPLLLMLSVPGKCDSAVGAGVHYQPLTSQGQSSHVQTQNVMHLWNAAREGRGTHHVLTLMFVPNLTSVLHSPAPTHARSSCFVSRSPNLRSSLSHQVKLCISLPQGMGMLKAGSYLGLVRGNKPAPRCFNVCLSIFTYSCANTGKSCSPHLWAHKLWYVNWSYM